MRGLQYGPETLHRRKPLKDCRLFYIDGRWVNPVEPHAFAVTNPATEEQIAMISLGSAVDVNNAVSAARIAFESYSETAVDERLVLLERIIEVYRSRMDEMS